MIIDNPAQRDIPGLRALWKQAFLDTDDFLDSFFSLAFSPERALVAKEGAQILGALYWFDCLCGEKRFAYIYAVATEKDHQGKGVCTALMKEAHERLGKEGKGTLLVPADNRLRAFYNRLGYRDFGGMEETTCFAGENAVPVEKLTAKTYAQRRRVLLPKNGVLQEGAFLPFLDANMRFYGGEDWLLAIGEGYAPEFLGDKALLPGILKTLQIPKAQVRCSGDTPFAMWRCEKEDFTTPGYFAFALD